MNSLSRTVFILAGNEGYGVRRAWLGIAQGFLERGQPITALAVAKGEITERLSQLGVTVRIAGEVGLPAPQGRGFRKWLSLLHRAARQVRLVAWLAREVQRAEAARVLLRNPTEVFLAGVASRLAGVDAFWLMPNAVSSDYPMDLNRRLYRFAFRYLNVRPIANSVYTRSTLGPGPFASFAMHLGVDPIEFDPELSSPITREALGLRHSDIVLGVFARMVPGKGQLRLVEALAAAGPAASDVHLLLFGGPTDTDYCSAISKIADKAGVSRQVHIVGPVATPRDYYGICDVVVNSRLDPEPFGLSVVEAMMMGRPVLAHKAGGPGETVIDSTTGWHIQGPNLEDFVAAISRMLDDRYRWGQMGAAARRHALEHFTSSAMTDRLFAILSACEK